MTSKPLSLSERMWSYPALTAHTKKLLQDLLGDIPVTPVGHQPALRSAAWATYRWWESLTRCSMVNLSDEDGAEREAVLALLAPFDDLARYAGCPNVQPEAGPA